MNFAAIPSGESVFLDANVFVYAFADDPKLGDPCVELLERVERGDLQGYLSTALLSDVAPRLMTLEACETLGWPYARDRPTPSARIRVKSESSDDFDGLLMTSSPSASMCYRSPCSMFSWPATSAVSTAS